MNIKKNGNKTLHLIMMPAFAIPAFKMQAIKIFAFVGFALALIFTTSSFISTSANSQDIYLQGAVGFGMIGKTDMSQAGGTDKSHEGDGFQNSFGIEGGLENLGATQNIRAGIGYTQVNLGLEKSGGVEGIDQSGTMLSANGYFYFDNPNQKRGAWLPYIGAGIGSIEFDDLGSQTAFMLHAGVDKSLNADMSFGGRYSMIMLDEASGKIDNVEHKVSDTTVHLFMANITYHLRGGL